MGEIADDIVSGDACCWCGVYFIKTHAYPVICDDCWKHSTPEVRKKAGVQRAIYPELE